MIKSKNCLLLFRNLPIQSSASQNSINSMHNPSDQLQAVNISR